MPVEQRHIAINIAPILQAFEQPLALVDDPERRGDFQRLLEMARFAVERSLFDAFSQAATVVNESQGDVRARLEYLNGTLNFVVEPATPERSEDGPAQAPFIEGDPEKVTIRIPKELKDLIDRAANFQGLSANSWYIRELSRTIARAAREHAMEERSERRRSNRTRRGSLHGFVGPD
jgi:hypothetical protein